VSNPYRWDTNSPRFVVEQRGELEALAASLREGGSAVLVGGRGMGKSVFLRRLADHLAAQEGVAVVRVEGPPPGATLADCLEALARRLGVAAPGFLHAEPILDAFARSHPELGAVVLLYDEIDQYTRHSAPEQPLGRLLLDHLEIVRRERPDLGILAAGGLGVFLLQHVFGSSFMSRAASSYRQPFDAAEIEALARPFADRGKPLSPEVLDALRLMSGGNPALATYGMQHLWALEAPTPAAVSRIYEGFQSRHRHFIRDVHAALTHPALSDAPRRVWALLQNAGGAISREALRAACAAPSDREALPPEEVLYLLAAAGLIRLEGSPRLDPIQARPVASILNLPAEATLQPAALREQLAADLGQILGRLHRLGLDFFRGRDRGAGGGRILVPESVFSAVIAVGLSQLGWSVEREAVQAAGLADIKARHPRFEGLALVEVKIWPRNDYKEIHQQLASYWTAEVAAGAAVMLADAPPEGWAAAYDRSCLAGLEREALAPPADLAGWWVARSVTPESRAVTIDHLLVRIPRRDH